MGASTQFFIFVDSHAWGDLAVIGKAAPSAKKADTLRGRIT